MLLFFCALFILVMLLRSDVAANKLCLAVPCKPTIMITRRENVTIVMNRLSLVAKVEKKSN